MLCESVQAFRLSDNVLDGEAELLHEQRARSGSTEAVDGDGAAFEAGVLVPAEAAGGFDHQALAAGGGKHALAVGRVLLFEKVHAGHGDDADVLAFSAQFGSGLHAEVELGAAAEED